MQVYGGSVTCDANYNIDSIHSNKNLHKECVFHWFTFLCRRRIPTFVSIMNPQIQNCFNSISNLFENNKHRNPASTVCEFNLKNKAHSFSTLHGTNGRWKMFDYQIKLLPAVPPAWNSVLNEIVIATETVYFLGLPTNVSGSDFNNISLILITKIIESYITKLAISFLVTLYCKSFQWQRHLKLSPSRYIKDHFMKINYVPYTDVNSLLFLWWDAYNSCY